MDLPDSMRSRLKAPLGTLIPDGRVDRDAILGHVRGAPCIITVGDRTTERVIGFGIIPDLQITDGRERRHARGPPRLPPGTVGTSCTNPAAQITGAGIKAVRDGLRAQAPVRLAVRGEEDLLVIPACIHAPDGAAVLYGQPGEGMVVVRVGAGIRRKTQTLLNMMMNRGNDETVAV